MPDTIQLMLPVIPSPGRVIYPLVRISSHSWPSGGFVSAAPIALIIQEGADWFFVPLEEGVTGDIIGQVIQE